MLVQTLGCEIGCDTVEDMSVAVGDVLCVCVLCACARERVISLALARKRLFVGWLVGWLAGWLAGG